MSKRTQTIPQRPFTLPRPAALRFCLPGRLPLPHPHAISVFAPQEPANPRHRLWHNPGPRLWANRPPRLLGESDRDLPHLLHEQVRDIPRRLPVPRLPPPREIFRVVSRRESRPSRQRLLAADVARTEVQSAVSAVAADRVGADAHMDAAAPSARAAAHVHPVFSHEQWTCTA